MGRHQDLERGLQLVRLWTLATVGSGVLAGNLTAIVEAADTDHIGAALPRVLKDQQPLVADGWNSMDR